MTTPKHTPAPWEVEGQHIKKGREVLALVNSIFGEDVMITNAKLIAKSPEMYTFIEKLVNAGSSIDILDLIGEGEKLLEEINDCAIH